MEEKKNGEKHNEKDKIFRLIAHYLKQQGKEVKIHLDGTNNGKKIGVTKKDIQKFLKEYPLQKLQDPETSLTIFTLRALYIIMSQTEIQNNDAESIIEIKPPCAELHDIISAAYYRGFTDAKEAQEKSSEPVINSKKELQ